jgi:hypothetical protein
MMFTVVLQINGRRIGGAQAINRSNLADVSDYDVSFDEVSRFDAGRGAHEKGAFKVEGHLRNQSAWALVREIASRITKSDEYERGVKDALAVCEKKYKEFQSPEYAGTDPMSSFAERFAVSSCKNGIAALLEKK